MAIGDWLVILPVIVPLFFAALAAMLRQRVRWQARIGIFAAGALVIAAMALFVKVYRHGPLAMTMGNWPPPFGISFTVDMLGALLSLSGSSIGFLVAIYALDDIDIRRQGFGFYPLFLIMMAGANGTFLTGDIFNLYVWLEVLLISAFGLLVLGGEKIQIDGAVKYSFLNLVATSLFLIATGLLYGLTGTLNFADLAIKTPGHASDDLLVVVALIYFVALAVKAAVFPLFFWLPASYHTPRFAVSALFAGLLTKVAVYAMFRLFTVVFAQGPEVVFQLMPQAAAATMVIGAVCALAQNELRRMLGFVVISGIGAMMLGLALGSRDAMAGGIFYIVHSMIVMVGLYLLAGAVMRFTGSERYAEIGGVYVASPLLAASFLILSLAVAGLPPFSGFWPKAILLRESLKQGLVWPAVALLASGFLVLVAIARAWRYIFLRAAPQGSTGDVAAAHEARFPPLNAAMIWPILILAAAAVVIGLIPMSMMPFAAIASDGLLDPTGYIDAVSGVMP